MNTEKLRKVAVYRAIGMSSIDIGQLIGLTGEHVRAYYFSRLNRMTTNEVLLLLVGINGVKLDGEE